MPQTKIIDDKYDLISETNDRRDGLIPEIDDINDPLGVLNHQNENDLKYSRKPDLHENKNENNKIPSKIQVKFEPETEANYNESNFLVNPWDVSNPSVFLNYCCPECDFKSGELFGFSEHAVMNHVLSNTLFHERDFDKSITIEINQEMNSNEAKLKFEGQTGNNLFDTKPKNCEMAVYDFVQNEETMESGENIETNSNVNVNLANIEKSTNICDQLSSTKDKVNLLKEDGKVNLGEKQ